MKRDNLYSRPSPKIILGKCNAIAPRRTEVEILLRAFRGQGIVVPDGADLLVLGSPNLSTQGEATGHDWSIVISALIANFPEFEAYFTITPETTYEIIEMKNIWVNTCTAHDHVRGHYRIFIFYPDGVNLP